MRSGDRPQGGYTLLLLLFAVAAMGLGLARTGQVWHTAMQREKETELLFIGQQFRLAIASYHEASPGPEKQFPRLLEDLVVDQRHPAPRHHLRKLYRDPMTGSQEWGLVLQQGRIVGVHSLAQQPPLRTRFVGRDASFDGASRYDQWVFLHEAPTSVARAVTPGKEVP